jgi:ATP-binding cassette subfamily F protein 3
MDHLRDLAPQVADQKLRSFLGGWNFAGERAFENVDTFSGGERARLALALIAWKQPNVLLLDEPTNHLDMDMREALAEALAEFAGALVLVAHDRHLLGIACDTFWRVADGEVTAFDGDLDDYARWLRSRDGGSGGIASGAGSGGGAKTGQGGSGAGNGQPGPTARERRREAAQQRKQAQPQRERIQRIEARLAQLTREREALERDLADPQLYITRIDGVAPLLQRQGALRTEQDALETEWLELQ